MSGDPKNDPSGWLVAFRKYGKILLFIPPILLGLFALVTMTRNARQPALREETEQGRLLRVISVPSVDVIPSVEAFGTVEPGRTWRAVAEVSGRIKSIANNLRAGAIQPAGTVLVTIDPTDYEYSVDRLTAQVEQADAQIEELDQSAQNLKSALAIEDETLKVSEGELQRLEQLLRDKVGSQSEVDAQKRAVLAQQQRTLDVMNTIKLLPSQRKRLLASRTLYTAQLEQARRDLDRTKIKAPFNCQIADVSVDVDQYLKTGEELFEAYGIALVKIEAQLPMSEAQMLVNRDIDRLHMAEVMADPEEMVKRVFDVTATVAVAGGIPDPGRPARFLNIREVLDPTTRTIGIVVGVDNPFENSIPGETPALVKGTYCRVNIFGKPRKDQVVVPRSSIQGNTVYVLGSDNRLRSKQVTVGFSQGDISVITAGLEAGENLIVSDPTPAIEGMLVEPQVDETLRQLVLDEATRGKRGEK